MTDPEVARILDRQAITDCLHRYAEAIDRCDNDLLAELFEADAALDYGVFTGSFTEFLEHRRSPGAMQATHHLIGNVRIAFDGLNHARSICYLSAVHRALRAGGLIDEMVRGRYLDTLVKRDGRWRIASRRLIYDWSRVDPAGPQWWESLGAEVATGSRDSNDPAAGFLEV